MDSSLPTPSTLFSIVSSCSLVRRSTRRKLLCRKAALSGFLSLAYLSFAPFINAPVVGQNVPDSVQPVTINFDNLATNTIVTNQYAQVKFSATGFSAGSGGSSGFDLYTQNNSGLGSSPFNAIRGRYNQYDSSVGCYGGSEVFLDFPMPVNNLSFLMLNMYANYFGSPYYAYYPYTAGMIDVYVNRLYYGTYNIDIPGQSRNPSTPFPINFLTGIQGITGIRITNTARSGALINAAPYPACSVIFYDDFTFTPDFDVRITNARVNGVLNGTTQNALVGADIALNANVIPSARSGGAYSWTFTGSPTIVSGTANSSSVTIRANDVGALTAKVTYTLNGFTATGSVTINALLPSLTSFTATMTSDQVNRNSGCSFLYGATYTLGCWTGSTDDGIVWNSTAQIPSGAYLTDPAQSGVKFVQVISSYRKRLLDGNTQCRTARSSESNIASGWQLDADPLNQPGHPVRYFSEGNTLPMSNFDPPGETIDDGANSYDAFLAADYFETYVFYFTGNPSQPVFQRAVGLSGSGYPYARLAWNWGGQVSFNYFSSPSLYRRDFTTTSPGSINATGINSLQPTSTNVHSLNYNTCAGTSATSNPIDGSRYFVQKLYSDFLGRPFDQDGLNYWRYNITQCAFDMNCVGVRRVDVARAFFYSGEFIQLHPALGGQRGTHDYNWNFVWACYDGFLRRAPNAPPDNNWDGFNYWVGVLDSTNPDAGDGKYNNIINAFLLSGEYRNRF